MRTQAEGWGLRCHLHPWSPTDLPSEHRHLYLKVAKPWSPPSLGGQEGMLLTERDALSKLGLQLLWASSPMLGMEAGVTRGGQTSQGTWRSSCRRTWAGPTSRLQMETCDPRSHLARAAGPGARAKLGG